MFGIGLQLVQSNTALKVIGIPPLQQKHLYSMGQNLNITGL